MSDLMAQGIAKSEAPISASSLEAATNELSRQLDRMTVICMTMEKTIGRVLRPGDSGVSSSPASTSDMDSDLGYTIMDAANRIRLACNHLEELINRVDL